MRVSDITLPAICLIMAGSIFAVHAEPAGNLADNRTATGAGIKEIVLSPLAAELQARLYKTRSTSKIETELIGDIKSYYETRRFEPVWIVDGRPTSQALALAEAMANARYDGLDPADYAVLDLASASHAGLPAIVEAELAATLAAARYVTHLAIGRIRPRSLSRHITNKPEKPAVADILANMSRSSDVGAELRTFEPKHKQYWALKDKLAELLDNAVAANQPKIPGGKTLRYGSNDPRVAILRRRLNAGPAEDGEPDQFDGPLLDAVKIFQEQNGLRSDGLVGPGTLAVLNRDNRENQISLMITNIERWRWLPRDLGAFHVAVNIPEYRVRVVDTGEIVHSTRVVVGKRSNPTPVFSDEMEHIIVNPYWNVPASILSNEMLPDIMIDPTGYFSRNGYELLARGIGWRGFRPVHPEMVDWFTVDPKSVLVRQPPGRSNALGRIKFMFPNRHAVYLHDTPAKNLFSRSKRAYSHGCVRVQDPMAFADALLVNEPDLDSRRLKQMFGNQERQVELTEHIPVHLTYFTATVQPDGSVDAFADIYGYDQVIRKLTNH